MAATLVNTYKKETEENCQKKEKDQANVTDGTFNILKHKGRGRLLAPISMPARHILWEVSNAIFKVGKRVEPRLQIHN